MPRQYKRTLGSRNYCNYSEETLQTCLEDVRSGKLSQRKAADKYKIPIMTLKNKLKNKHSRKPGGRCVFNENEEKTFVQHLIKLSEFGFPVTETDFRMIVKAYLDKRGAVIKKFKDNTPGPDWMKSFMKRYPELTVRFSQNVKRVRAGITEETIEKYVNHLHEELDGVPPSNIWNYDETNVSDDPGNKRAICKRGTKYLDRICNHSKSSTSIMFCGNAEGRLLPPYVVFKADHIWSTWVDHGPEGARYNRSKSGWFNGVVFEDWFKSHFLPSIRHLVGPVALIGDNLSSHISEEVLRLCTEKNIKFICLPPNATHIAQPLDVAFFGPLKRAWRTVLSEWRDTADGSKYPTIPKEKLPVLLKELMLKIKDNEVQNLISGFRKCGIVPIDKNVLLAQLPNIDVENDLVGEVFMASLIEKRKEVVGGDSKRLRRKKINVSPGKSITINDLLGPEAHEASTSSVAEASSCSSVEKTSSVVKNKKKRRLIIESSSDSEADISLESDGCSENLSLDTDELEENNEKDELEKNNEKDELEENNEEDELEENNEEDELEENNEKEKGNYEIGNFVIVIYSGIKYPGMITQINNDGPIVDCLVKGNKNWYWPEKKDKMEYPWSSVIKKIDPPRPVSTKRCKYFSVPELNMFI